MSTFNSFTKALIVLIFLGFGLVVYAGSVRGWGISGMDNPKTRAEIEQNCPNYYRTKDGDCLQRTFRSYYLVRAMRGGGFGGGGK